MVTTTSAPLRTASYLSTQDYRQMPTGVDTQALVKGDAGATDAELKNRIRAASAWADNIMGRNQPVVATVDTELRKIRLRPSQEIMIAPRLTPVIAVTAFAIGAVPNSLAAMSDLSNIWIDPDGHFFEVPTQIGFTSSAGPLQFSAPRPGGQAYARFTLTAGWPHTTLAVAATAGASNIQVASSVGVLPGLSYLTIYDGAATETVQVSASYDGVSTTVPITGTLGFAHGQVGCTVSALPDDIRQAVGLLTSTLIQTRGAVAVIAPQINALAGRLTQGGANATGTQSARVYVDANVKTATDLLARFHKMPRS